MTLWLGYAEPHHRNDTGRKRDGTATRATRAPEAVLTTPEEVASWISQRVRDIAATATPGARVKNALMVHPWQTSKATAKRGSNVYRTVHVDGTHVVDLCVDIRDDSACSASAKGHNYQENSHGQWRCVHCGEQL